MGKRSRRPVVVYLICFDRPLRHARHYLGSAADLDARLEAHRKGTGAKLMAAVMRAGIGWRVVRTWEAADGRAEEKRLKKWENNRKLCPVCMGDRVGDNNGRRRKRK